MKKVLAILLFIIIGLLAYIAFKSKEVVAPVEQMPSGQTTTINNPNGTDYFPNGNPMQEVSETKTYKTNDFSFQYSNGSSVKVTSNDKYDKLYVVSKAGGYSENITLIPTTALATDVSICDGLVKKTTIINNKNFIYCSSNAEPATLYIYTKGDETLLISVQGTAGKSYTYVDPGSVEIY